MRESPPPSPPPLPADTRLATRFQEAARVMEQHFLDKQEVIRLLLVSVAAGEHMLLVGPPGTAKSALVRTFARLIDARYFEYLLTRFTEPNELFGPVDIRAFREGTYTRKTETMLPEAELVFLDEIFKSNSAILNSLLTILNERKFSNGSQHHGRAALVDVRRVQRGAERRQPGGDLRPLPSARRQRQPRQLPLPQPHRQGPRQRGGAAHRQAGRRKAAVHRARSARACTSASTRTCLHRRLPVEVQGARLPDPLRGHLGLRSPRGQAAQALRGVGAIVDGRDQANDSDFFIFKHIWNNLDQTEILEEIVGPVVDRWYRDHPQERRFAAGQVGLDDLLGELQIIRELLTSGEALSDIQLFSQLKNLNEIKAALQAVDSETARRMVAEVDALLENVFASSKFG